ncbi:MAG: glycosyltransferase family 4 protein [Acidimicrobiales bacterium]|nr:glycosyltransferase family 4 protein [Acidimicrobiales bacterium]
MTPPPVLFLGHGADRTGPPVFLANFQRWLAAQGDLPFVTALTRGGPLLAEYRQWGPVRVLDPRWTALRVAQHGLARAGLGGPASRLRAARDRGRLRTWRDAPFVYLNTASPATLRTLALVPPTATVVAHVHELEVALRYQLAPAERTLLLERPRRFIAASQAVADNLVATHGVAASRIEVHHEFVQPVPPVDPERRGPLRAAAGIDPEAFVVIGSGMTEWRKGPDLFVALAAALRERTDRPLAFLWVGGATAGPTWWPLDHEARHLGVDRVVRFLGAQDDPGAWFRLADAFALTSREDAFPLAALEAATAGVPLVTFDTGGMVELVHDGGAGAVVPYPDVEAFADVLAGWSADETERRRLGAAAAAHTRAHHVTEVAAPVLRRALQDLGAW